MSMPITAMDKVGVIEKVIDYAKAPSTAAQVVEVFPIPAGSYVLFAGAEVIKTEGAAAAGTLGDTADPDGWVASLDGNAEGIQAAQGAYAGGKFYAQDDALEHVTTNALSGAVIRYFAVVANVSGN